MPDDKAMKVIQGVPLALDDAVAELREGDLWRARELVNRAWRNLSSLSERP